MSFLPLRVRTGSCIKDFVGDDILDGQVDLQCLSKHLILSNAMLFWERSKITSVLGHSWIFAVFPSGSTELVPGGALDRKVEKLKGVLGNGAIRKEVPLNKSQKKPAQHLQFSKTPHERQSSKPTDC